MTRNLTHNFHLPLPNPLYEKLREEAKRTKQPATTIARKAIEDWLKLKKKEQLYDELVMYAENYGGTEYDLDENLEKITIEHLLSEESHK